MKKLTLMLAGACVAAGLLAGCGGNSVDENKTPAQIKQEIKGWDSTRIQKSIDDYKKAIEAKTAELNAELAKVKELAPQDLLSDAGRELKTNTDKIGESLGKLKDNLEVYMEELKAKAAK